MPNRIHWPDLKLPPINLWNAPHVRIRESKREKTHAATYRAADLQTLNRLLANH